MTQPSWQNLFKEARSALKEGHRSEARRLARQVVKLAPKQEAPWLLLAATAEPKASIGYLKQALAINPKSRRAKQALRWANKKEIQGRPAPVATRHSAAKGGTAIVLPKGNMMVILAVGALAFSLALLAWLRPIGVEQSLKVLSAGASNSLSSLFASQMSSPTPTSAGRATASSSPTEVPTETSVPTASATTVPPTATNTPVVTNGPEAVEAQKKFKAAVPAYLGAEEHWIDVNLTTQMVTAFEGNRPMRSFTVSTGRGATPTVVGEFRVWVKVRIQDMSGPGYYIRDVPYVMYFFEDYGIHGTHWHNNFGTPMSAGCVNMTIDDSQWMYEFAEVGTLVKVHY